MLIFRFFAIAAKLLTGSKNQWAVKWSHWPPLPSCKVWFKSNNTRRCEETKCSTFCVTLTQFDGVGNVVNYFNNTYYVGLSFLGRIGCGLHLFTRKKSPLQRIKQVWKLSLDRATIGAIMREKIFKIWENGWKVCVHHFDHLKLIWKNTSTTAFYSMYCRCAPI